MNQIAYRIGGEFRSYVPPLSAEERAQLEQNIRTEGCLSPLVVWGDIIVDGHNRYEICSRLGLPFDTVQRFFPDREAALDWMDAHQLGRRNLSPDARRLLLGRRYNRLKKAANDGGAGVSKATGGQNDPRLSTAATLAKEHGSSEKTVKRAGKFAAQVDADPALQAAVAAGFPVAKARPRPEPIEVLPANDHEMPAAEASYRRKLAGLTEAGLIDEAAGLHADLTDALAKLMASDTERESLKNQMKEFLSTERHEVIRRQAAKISHQASQVLRANDEANHFKGKSAVLERKLKAAEKRIKEMEALLVDAAA